MMRTTRVLTILCATALLWGCGDDDETTNDVATDTPMTDTADTTETPETPADPAEPADPADPADTIDPADPADTIDPADPSDDPLPEDPENPDATPDYDVYKFDSRFDSDKSSIVYTGQSARHALISILTDKVKTLTEAVDAEGSTLTEAGKVTELLDIYFRCAEGICDDEAVTVGSPEQATVGDISGGKNLTGKIAGNDRKGQYKNWNGYVETITETDENGVETETDVFDLTTSEFMGWGQEMSPELLVDTWIGMLDAAAVDRGNDVIPNDPDGDPITKIYVTEQGHDLSQLLQKFLLGAVAFSQGADDYLDYDTDGKGLLVDNETAVEGKPYTALEHNWDEGFGYFGAARDFLGYTDDEIAKKGGRGHESDDSGSTENWQGAHDTNGDGVMDLSAEVNWGHSVNAAKRDRGATTMMVDLTKDAFDAFFAGRTLIAENPVLTETQMEELKAYSDTARLAWEKSIAATAIHYVNDVIIDLEAEEYDFYDHAKHWSELKGFVLSLQFSPLGKLTVPNHMELNGIIGTAPSLPTADGFDLATRKANLERARTVLGDAYDFDNEDVINW